ncbi:MAG: hypothetical protein US50_C0001G0004 [Candidatus Nomurabacteria bacterium GW2011_GWB1_37_5]|uniref:Uncharacterized protein n=1 Tax=Candidatus Nomurabacteria bacterium GW2011_GWB1_37_5 TaxID=1618742 RepID=A0A0G0H1D1_9BACT|nr:MAG: hypothetical protein US50_C0001G0004 [Candidatus Nomurabacteria bacterium GW2011_GWB1_37_5]
MKKLILLSLLISLSVMIWLPVSAQTDEKEIMPVSFCLSSTHKLASMMSDIQVNNYLKTRTVLTISTMFIEGEEFMAIIGLYKDTTLQPGFYVKNGKKWCWVASLFYVWGDYFPSHVRIYKPKERFSYCDENESIELVYTDYKGGEYSEIFDPKTKEVVAIVNHY